MRRSVRLAATPSRTAGGDNEVLLLRLAHLESRDRYLDDILHRLQRLEDKPVTGGVQQAPALEQSVVGLQNQVHALTTTMDNRVQALEDTMSDLDSRMGSVEAQLDALLKVESVPAWYDQRERALLQDLGDQHLAVDRLQLRVADLDDRLENTQAIISLLQANEDPWQGARAGADSPPQDQHQEQVSSAAEPLRASAGTSRSKAPAASPSKGSSTSSSSSSGSGAPPVPPSHSHAQRQAHTSGGAASQGRAPTVGQDPGVWAQGLGAMLPRQPRAPPDFPHLAAPGYTTQGGQAYMRWQTAAYAEFRGAGIDAVVDHVGPPPDAHPKILSAYTRASGIVYACIQRACAGIPVLVDEVMNVARLPDYGLRAWLAVRDHYIKLASTNRSILQSELHNLKPRDGESMDGFLARCETLRTKFLLFNLVLEDKDLIVQIYRGLSHSWRTAVRQFHQGQDPEDLPWSVLQADLRKIDTERRQSCTTVPGAELPLGATPKGQGKQGGQPQGRAAPSQAAGKTGFQPKGKQGGESGGGRKSRDNSPQKGKPGASGGRPKGIIVCYHCHGAHAVSDCKTKPADWQLTAELKAAADRIRDAKLQQSKATRRVRMAMASSARLRSEGSETASTSLGVASRGGATSSEPDPGSRAAQSRVL